MNALNKDSLLEYLKFNQKNKQSQLEHIQANDWEDTEVICELAVYGKIIQKVEEGGFDISETKPITFKENLQRELGTECLKLIHQSTE